MSTTRTALADMVTIFTGISTLAGGIYSMRSGKAVSIVGNSSGEYWNIYLQHGIAVVVTVISLYFFLNQSLKLAKRVVESGSSAMPAWLVMGLFYCAGIALFCVFQIVFQSNLFEEAQWVYLIASLSVWFIVTIPLLVVSLIRTGSAHSRRRRTRQAP